jgi:predicted ribosomally synthesized peptide with nif11-like leader
MSANPIQAFFEKAKSSPELQQKITEIHHTAAQSTAEALAALSEESGSPFTAEEFLAETRLAASEELSEEELGNTAGGISFQTMWVGGPPKAPTQGPLGHANRPR